MMRYTQVYVEVMVNKEVISSTDIARTYKY